MGHIRADVGNKDEKRRRERNVKIIGFMRTRRKFSSSSLPPAISKFLGRTGRIYNNTFLSHRTLQLNDKRAPSIPAIKRWSGDVSFLF